MAKANVSGSWIGALTEETLKPRRQSDPPVSSRVATPRARLSALEKAFLGKPWEQAREAVSVKLLAQEGEWYLLAKSEGRLHQERAIRRRTLNHLWKRLHELQQQKLTRDQLLVKLGAAKKEAARAYFLLNFGGPKTRRSSKPTVFALRGTTTNCAKHADARAILGCVPL